MANIEQWSNCVIIQGPKDSVKALVAQGTKSYPALEWDIEEYENTKYAKRKIVWQNTNYKQFRFWNFDHPSEDEIVSYFNKNGKRVQERAWNREHWGCAYEPDSRGTHGYLTKSGINAIYTQERSAVLRNLRYKDDKLIEYVSTTPTVFEDGSVAVLLHLSSSDFPDKIWSKIVELYPDVTITSLGASDAAKNKGLKVDSSGTQVLYDFDRWNLDNTAVTHDSMVLALGSCPCEDKDGYSERLTPQECIVKRADKLLPTFISDIATVRVSDDWKSIDLPMYFAMLKTINKIEDIAMIVSLQDTVILFQEFVSGLNQTIYYSAIGRPEYAETIKLFTEQAKTNAEALSQSMDDAIKLVELVSNTMKGTVNV